MVNLKKNTEILLDSLKHAGITRRQIEREFDLSENYIAQAQSRGGSEKFYKRLKKWAEIRLQSATENDDTPIKVKADLGEEIGRINERLIRLESYSTVLFETCVNLISNATGKQAALVSSELDEAVSMTSKKRLAELRRKGV